MLNKYRTSILMAVVMTLVISSIASAGSPSPSLPPRPTPLPTSMPAPSTLSGALIELRVPTTSLNYFTIVQWQMSTGVWQTVESWQGNLDDVLTFNGMTYAYKRWWVYATDYGQRNFRWQVYDRPNGKLLDTSATFDLPTRDKEDVISYVTLP